MSFAVISMKFFCKLKESLCRRRGCSHSEPSQEVDLVDVVVVKDGERVRFLHRVKDSIHEIIVMCMEPFI